MIVETMTSDRKQTAFRLRTDLLDRLKVAAMKGAKENKYLETPDLDKFDELVESLK